MREIILSLEGKISECGENIRQASSLISVYTSAKGSVADSMQTSRQKAKHKSASNASLKKAVAAAEKKASQAINKSRPELIALFNAVGVSPTEENTHEEEQELLAKLENELKSKRQFFSLWCDAAKDVETNQNLQLDSSQALFAAVKHTLREKNHTPQSSRKKKGKKGKYKKHSSSDEVMMSSDSEWPAALLTELRKLFFPKAVSPKLSKLGIAAQNSSANAGKSEFQPDGP